MRLSDVQVKEITTSTEYEDSVMLLANEFLDHTKTDLTYYEYIVIAKKQGEVIGIVTANKYLPHKVLISDIVIAPEHRGQAVAVKLLNYLTQKVKSHGYKYITGITPHKNKAALNMYKKLGGKQEEMIVTTALLDDTIAIMNQKEQMLLARENRGKEG